MGCASSKYETQPSTTTPVSPTSRPHPGRPTSGHNFSAPVDTHTTEPSTSAFDKPPPNAQAGPYGNGHVPDVTALPASLDDTKYKQIKRLQSPDEAAEVFLVENREDGRRYQIKLIERGTLARENFLRELKTMVVMRHPHIIKLREAFLTQDHLAIVMEHASLGDLLTYVTNKQYADGTTGRLKEKDALWFFQQAIVALDYMHLLGFSSRDFKLENCGLVPGRMAERPLLKLMDFASSKDTRDDSPAQTLVGSTPYIAPEMMFPPYDAQKADLWCAGVFLYWLMCGQPPFGEIPNFGRIGAVRYPGAVSITPDLDDLLRKLLVKVPEERLTLEQLKQHPWFLQGLPARAFDNNVPAKPIPPEVHRQVEELAGEAGRRVTNR